MRIDLSQAKPSGTELVTANITSLTLLLSTTVFLAVICRYFKRCWKKLRGKPKKDLDMTALSPVGKISLHKNRSTAMHTRRRHMIRQDKIPFDTEDVSVQPVLYTDMSIKDDPMSPGFFTNSRNYCKFGRQQSTPLRLERRSIITSRRDIKSFDLDPSLYKKEESLKSFQASSRKKCGIIDMEVYFDEKARQLEVILLFIRSLILLILYFLLFQRSTHHICSCKSLSLFLVPSSQPPSMHASLNPNHCVGPHYLSYPTA